jgi:hypothetical protein
MHAGSVRSPFSERAIISPQVMVSALAKFPLFAAVGVDFLIPNRCFGLETPLASRRGIG